MTGDQITTSEELEALPDVTVTVLLDHNGNVLARDGERGWEDRVWWATGSDVPENPVLPATALYRPDRPTGIVSREQVGAVSKVLAKHVLDEGANVCECKKWEMWEVEFPERITSWTAHVATALTPTIDTLLAEAWDESERNLSAYESGYYPLHPNPYRKATT